MPQGYDGLPPSYIGLGSPLTPNLGLSLAGMDPIIAENFWLIDVFAAGGGGTSVFVNGVSVSNPDFNDTTPAAPPGFSNILWQVSGSSVSAYAQASLPAGNDGDVQFNNAGAFGGTDNFFWDNVNSTLVLFSANNPYAFQIDDGGIDQGGGGIFGIAGDINISGTQTGQVRAINIPMHVVAGGNVATLRGINITANASGGGVISNYIGMNLTCTGATHMTGINVGNFSNGGDTFSRAIVVNGGIVEFVDGACTFALGSNPIVNAVDVTTGFFFDITSLSPGNIWTVNVPDGNSSFALGATPIAGSFLTGFNSSTGQFSFGVSTTLWNNLQNATGNLTLANAGFTSTFNQTSAVNWTWANTTAATNIASQSSPIFNLNGTYWNGSASSTDGWTVQDVIASGTNGASTLTFLQTGSNGNARVQVPSLLSLANNPTLTFVQTASDTMARSNENPMSNGGNWVSGGGAGVNAGQLVSNKFEATAVNTAAEAVWTGNGAGFNSADQYSEVKLAASTSTSTQVGPMVRCSTSATTHYRLSVSGVLGGSPNWTLYSVVAGTPTTLSGPNTFTFAVNDLVRLAVIGTSLYCYKNGTLFYTTTDSSIATGVPGMIAFESAGAITDAQISSWTGGTVTAPSGPYTGNVTLQNAQSALAALSYSSPVLQFAGQFWNGSASALDQWNVQNIIGTGANGASDLTISRTSTSTGRASVVLPAQGFLRWSSSTTGPSNPGNVNAGLAQTAGVNNGSLSLYTNNASSAILALFQNSTNVWNFTQISGTINWTAANTYAWNNTTAATSGTSQSSPALTLNGKYWDGAASQTDTWTIKTVVANGTNGASTLSLAHTGTTGVSAIEVPAGSTPPTWGIKFAGLSQGISAVASNIQFDCGNNNGGIQIYSGSTQLSIINHQNSPTNNAPALTASIAGSAAGILGRISTQIAQAAFAGNVSGVHFAGTSAGTQVGFSVGIGTGTTNGCVRFIPASGATNFYGVYINPEINQTGSASGNYSGLVVNVVETSLKGTANLLLDLQAGATGGTSEFAVNNVGVVTKYAATTTVGQGIGAQTVTVDRTAQSAAITATNLTASAPRTGMYRISWSATITTAATTSSVLGGTNGFQIGFTSPTDSVAKTVVPGNSTTSAANTTGTAVAGSYVVYAKTGTAITYAFDYTSTGGTAMVYELHVRMEEL